MERLSDQAIEIINELHTERLDYNSEYLPLIEAALLLAAYEDTGLEPNEIENTWAQCSMMKGAITDNEGNLLVPLCRLRELAQADQKGCVVVLPFPLHSTLFDASNEARPELLKDFRLSATWTHCGIVFHSPWSIFLNNIERGYIKQMSEEAEAALEGGKDG